MNYLLAFLLIVFLSACSSTSEKLKEPIKPQKILKPVKKEIKNCLTFECHYKKALKGDTKSQKKVLSYYLNKNEFKKAEPWLIKLANKKDFDSIKTLASYYDFGKGEIKIDKQKAFSFYEKGLSFDDPFFHYHVGYFYKRGWGVNQDFTKAMSYFKLAANKNYIPAYSEIGFFYAKGLGIEQDYDKAFSWFEKGSNSGDKYAMSWLGYLYEIEKTKKQDLKKAVYWYEKAGTTYSKEKLKILNKKGIIK